MAEPVYCTPPEAAKRWRVKADKVRAWITRGELRAIDVSDRPGTGRPRWRIPIDAVIEFESRRAAKPPIKQPPRRKRRKQLPEGWVQYF